MIDKFIDELKSKLKEKNIQDDKIVSSYQSLFDKYIKLGQSEFDIIRHFGEVDEIVDNYIAKGALDLPNMDDEVSDEMPSYLIKEEPHEEIKEKKEENIAPTTKAGLIVNDIFFVGLGLLVALAGCIAVAGVAIFLTAGSVYQMVDVCRSPIFTSNGARVGAFFLSFMVFVISGLMYFIVVWIVKVVVKFMKRYTHDHRENWKKLA